MQHLAELEAMEVYTPPAPGEFPPLFESWGWGDKREKAGEPGGGGKGSTRGRRESSAEGT